MKNLFVALLTVTTLVLSLSAATITCLNGGAANNAGKMADYALYSGRSTAGVTLWSDGQDPSAANDYVVPSGISIYVPVSYAVYVELNAIGKATWGTNPFQGKTLTIQNGATMKLNGNTANPRNPGAYAFKVNRLILDAGSAILGDGNTYGEIKESIIEVKGTSTNPSQIIGGVYWDGISWENNFRCTFVGAATSELKCARTASSAQNITSHFLEASPDFLGTINIGMSMTVDFGASFENATVRLTDPTAALSATNLLGVSSIKVKGMQLTDGNTISAIELINNPKCGFEVTTTFSQTGVTKLDMLNQELDSMIERVVFLKVPETAGPLNVSNFKVVNAASDRYSVKVVRENGMQIAAVYNGNYEPGPTLPDLPTSFITKTKNDYWTGEQTCSYRTGYAWSDGQAPHAGANYKVSNGYELYCRQITVPGDAFAGDSIYLTSGGMYLWFVFNNTPALIETYKVTIDKLFIGQGGYIRGENTSTNTYTLCGSFMEILANSSGAAELRPSAANGGIIVNHALMGAGSAWVRCRCGTVGSPAVGAYMTYVDFKGSLLDYFGTIEAGLNSTVTLHSTMPSGKVDVSGANSYVAFELPDDSKAYVKQATVEAGGLRVPVNAELGVGTLKLTGSGALDMSEFSMEPGVNCGLVISNSFVAPDDVIRLDFRNSGITGAQKKVKLISVPLSVATIAVENFDIVNCIDTDFIFSVEVEDEMQVLYVENPEYGLMPSIPSDFGPKTGYVTLTATETSSSVSSRGYSYNSTGLWSEYKIPHIATNYAVKAGQEFWIPQGENAIFKGDRLAVAAGGAVRFAGNSTSGFEELCLMPGAKLTAPGASGTNTVGGKVYIYGAETAPTYIYGGANGQVFNITADLVGTASKYLATRSSARYINEYWSEIDLNGDTSAFRGTLYVGTNTTVRIGSAGMPVAKVYVDSDYSCLGTCGTNGSTVVIGSLNYNNGDPSGLPGVDVAAGNILIADEFTLRGVLKKGGQGTFAADQMNAGMGAAIEVAEGGLGVWSSVAFRGIPVTFGDGATLHVPFASGDDDLEKFGFHSASEVIVEGMLNIAVDLNGATPPEDRIARVNFLTVPAADAGFYRNRIGTLRAPWAGGKTMLAESTTNNFTTFSMKIQPNGFGVILE